MAMTEVRALLGALAEAGCWVALEGGWGVDALAGRQTRPHRDLDVDVRASQAATVLEVLHRMSYAMETDWWPNRLELVCAGRGWVDVHPLALDSEGDGIQTGLNGERYLYPAASFVTGRIGDRAVRCISISQQIDWHAGYTLRESDHADLAVLHQLARDSRSGER